MTNSTITERESIATTNQPTKQQSIVDLLRTLADTIEQHDLQIKDWATVRIFNEDIGISDEDFVAMFRGQVVQGKREGAWIRVRAEYAGLIFSASLYRPLPGFVNNSEAICI